MTTPISKINIEVDFVEIHAIRQIAVTEYSTTISKINKTSDKLHLGTCLILMKSLYNHLTSLELLIEKCYIESSGAIATSLWEKSITLQYLILDPKNRIELYSKHDTFKKTPWNIKTMVTDIVKNEPLLKGKKIEDNIDLLYMQYSYLCAIKHGNPYTVMYLNRVQEGENFFEPSPRILPIDKDILGLLYLFSVTTLFDALLAFSKSFCFSETYENLKHIDGKITANLSNIDLKVPTIIMTSVKDFRPEFWDLLIELVKRIS